MRKVPHPEKIFIQISDENPRTLGIAFNDDYDNPESIDPNAFDVKTIIRCEQILSLCIDLLEKRLNGSNIPELNPQPSDV